MGPVIAVAYRDSCQCRQCLSPPKQRYSWARVDGRRPLPWARRLKCPLSAGHISNLCRGKRQYLCYSLVPSAGGGGSNSRCITDECLQFEAVPTYVMSQHEHSWQCLGSRRLELKTYYHNWRSQLLRSLHLHVLGSTLGYRCRCGELSFSWTEAERFIIIYLTRHPNHLIFELRVCCILNRP